MKINEIIREKRKALSLTHRDDVFSIFARMDSAIKRRGRAWKEFA